MANLKELPFSEEFPHLYGLLKWVLLWVPIYSTIIALAIVFPVWMGGFAVGFICAAVGIAWEIGSAKADRSPQGRDKGTLGSVHESGGPEGICPNSSSQQHQER